MKVKDCILQHRHFFLEIFGCFVVTSIYLSGVGRYRVVLVFAVYLLLRAFSALVDIEKTLTAILLPALVVALYFDVTKGAFFPLYNKNSLIVALALVVVFEILSRQFLSDKISKLSDKKIFVVCPKCSFDNEELVLLCRNCNYGKNGKDGGVESSGNSIALEKYGEGWIAPSLNLRDGESLEYYKKLSADVLYFKNNNRSLLKRVALTKSKMFFLDIKKSLIPWKKSIRSIDYLNIEDINSISVYVKYIHMSKRPFLEISTQNNCSYVIVMSRLSDYKRDINRIINYIKDINKNVSISFDLSQLNDGVE